MAAKILQSGRAAFHRQQLLYMMKAAAVSCGGKERDWTKADFEQIGVLCLMGSDLLPTIPEEKSCSDLERFVRFVLHFAPIDEAAPHYPEHNITRAYLMLTDSLETLRNSKMFVDVRQVFENAAGMATNDYFFLMLATLTRFFKFNEVEYAKNPNSYMVDASWFSSTTIEEKTVSKLLEDMSATPLELAERAKKETGPADFTVFRDRALVRTGESFYPVDFEFLATKTEAHVYWTVLRSLTVDDQGKFQAFWGKLFERYVADLLASAANDNINAVLPFAMYTNDEGKELCDVVVKCKDAAVLIECKGTMFRGDAKYKGDVRMLEAEIVRKFVNDGRPVGVGQLATAVRTILHNPDCTSGITFRGINVIFPLLVTRDEIGSVVGFNSYLKEQFKALLPAVKRMPFSVAPLICTSIQGLERWCAYLSEISLADILHSHLQANKNITDPLLRLARPLPPFVVDNPAIDAIGYRESRLQKDWKKMTAMAAERLGLKPE